MWHKLTKLPDWEWTKAYGNMDKHLGELTKAFQTSINGIQCKFGVEIPKGVQHAMCLDRLNGNQL